MKYSTVDNLWKCDMSLKHVKLSDGEPDQYLDG